MGAIYDGITQGVELSRKYLEDKMNRVFDATEQRLLASMTAEERPGLSGCCRWFIKTSGKI